MLNPPSGQELLSMAHSEELKLADPEYLGNRRYVSALIARARDIAMREVAQGAALWRRERELLNELYPDGSDTGDVLDIQHWLYTLNIRLAADLRARRLGHAQQAKVLDLLTTQVRARLAICNPKYLETADSNE